jgi:transcriptional regulator with XRE-family HTH domain
MPATYLSQALLALASTGSARALAEKVGVSPSTLSKLISTDRRIDENTLHKLCANTEGAGLELLLAHLRDEVDRAGRLQTEVGISGDELTDDADIRVLAHEAIDNSELRDVLRDLARMVRAARAREAAYRQDELQLAAVGEAPGVIPPKKRTTGLAAAAEAEEQRRLEQHARKAETSRSPRATKRPAASPVAEAKHQSP